ncbi:MAG: hypothetical protein ACI81I_000523 [Arcobacteraceae bacterium]|jgi:hypothetical protein
MILQKQQFDKIINYCNSELKEIILDINTLQEYKLAPYRVSYRTYLFAIKYCKFLMSTNQRIYKYKLINHFKLKRGDEKYCKESIYKIINFVGSL